MRLFELFEEVPTKTVTTPMKSPRARSRDQKTQMVGDGSFSRVYQHADNPHEVMKFSHAFQAHEDGYHDYILEIAKDKEIQANPWTPRILSIRSHKDEDGSLVNYSVRLEALQPLSSLSFREVESICERTFDRKSLEKIYQEAIKFPKNTRRAVYVESLMLELYRALKSEEYVYTFAKDPHLIEYMEWHQYIWMNYTRQHTIDLHDENIMVRRTPYGPQLVITDPWA